MNTWTTDTVNERERFSYWREMICNTLFSISPEAPGDRFSARLAVRTTTAHFALRCANPPAMKLYGRNATSPALPPISTLSTCSVVDEPLSTNAAKPRVHRNDIVLSDCRQPYRASLSDDGCRAVALVPRAMVN